MLNDKSRDCWERTRLSRFPFLPRDQKVNQINQIRSLASEGGGQVFIHDSTPVLFPLYNTCFPATVRIQYSVVGFPLFLEPPLMMRCSSVLSFDGSLFASPRWWIYSLTLNSLWVYCKKRKETPPSKKRLIPTGFRLVSYVRTFFPPNPTQTKNLTVWSDTGRTCL